MARKYKSSNRGGNKGQNRKTGESFLEKNAHKPGVVTTDSGLQYLIIEEGDGPVPFDGDRVKVHQRITLVDGKILADTYREGMAETFPLSEAIEGYGEGLRLMKTGSRYKFFIPPELAWGKRGVGSRIGPNAVIIIDSALLGIV